MLDHKFSICATVAVTAWAVVLGLMVTATVLGSLFMAAWAVVISVAAATVTLRTCLRYLLQNTFELARDARVHNLR